MTTSCNIASFRKCRRVNCAKAHCVRSFALILKIGATKTFGGTRGGALARESLRPAVSF